MFDIRHISVKFFRSFLFHFLQIIIILAFFHNVGICLSDKHLVYNLASVFEMVSSPSCFQCIDVSSRFFNSSWNSIFFDPIYVASTLGGLLVINFIHFLLYVQFDVARNQPVVTSNVDLVDDFYVCDDVWPVC